MRTGFGWICSVLLASTALGGCYYRHGGPAWERIRAESAEGKVRQLEKGDVARVTTTKGKVHIFRVAEIEDDAFLGWGEDDRKYRVPAETIRKLEVRNQDPHYDGWLLLVPPPVR